MNKKRSCRIVCVSAVVISLSLAYCSSKPPAPQRTSVTSLPEGTITIPIPINKEDIAKPFYGSFPVTLKFDSTKTLLMNSQEGFLHISRDSCWMEYVIMGRMIFKSDSVNPVGHPMQLNATNRISTKGAEKLIALMK